MMSAHQGQESLPEGNHEMRENKKDAVIEVNGKSYQVTIFAIQAQAAYAKSLIFAAEALVAIKSSQYIWAAIASYYSLFHLSISLMYVLPRLIEPKLLASLVTGRAEGTEDPTRLIPHKYLPRFLANCESMGLTVRLRKLLENAREIREYANYRPRSVWQSDRPIFKTREFSRADVERIATSIEPLLSESLLWASRQNELSGVLSSAAAISLDWFLNQDDLLYAQWCSPEVLSQAREMRRKLPGASKS